jgi:hypothetical protein
VLLVSPDEAILILYDDNKHHISLWKSVCATDEQRAWPVVVCDKIISKPCCSAVKKKKKEVKMHSKCTKKTVWIQ